jgi:hypothetical protein
VDEYDKPLLNILNDTDEENPICKALKGFYGVLKSADGYLRFVFLTGVTKFSKVSVFSEMNHLTDISLNENYAGICGISEPELNIFEPEIRCLALKLGKTYKEMLNELQKRYNGYHFSKKGEGMYNPYSLLRTFVEGKLLDYWFETGIGKLESFSLKAFFAGISYKLNNKTEKHYQTIFYVLLKLMDQFIEVEQDSAVGRANAVITADDTVYVFEFKLAGKTTAEDALKQIDDRGYLIPLTDGNKRLVKVGAEFSAKIRGLSRWVVEKAA